MSKYFLFFLAAFSISSTFADEIKPKEPCANFHVTGLNLKVVAPFIENVKQNIIKNQIKQLAEQVSYPVKFNSRKKKKAIKDKKAFLAEFPKFINKKWKQMVVGSNEKNAVCNSEGVGLNKGSLWITAPRFHTKPNVLKIIAINVY